MNCLVVGAGNAGRPVARLLNNQGENVIITDPKTIDEFKEDVQKILKQIEKEGVVLDLGNPDPSVDGIDMVYKAPTLPDSAPISKKIKEANLKVLSNEEFSKMVNDLIPVDILGITGTMGKTTTTFITTAIFKQAGYKVWACSSLVNNLVSEAIIEGIVKGKAEDCDIAIFELPHGTIGLLDRLDIKIGLLANIAEDHLSEFGGSLERYRNRKLILEKMSKTFISNNSCREVIESIRDDAIFFELNNPNSIADFTGFEGDESLTIKYPRGEFTTPFHMMSYFFEDSLAASALALEYGIQHSDIVDTLSDFRGLPAHMQDLGEYNGRRVILDSAFLYDGMKITLEYFKDENVVLFLDHFDTLSKRDKSEVGNLVGQYVDTVLASGFNEVTQSVEMEAAYEVLDAIDNPNATKVPCRDITEAAELTFKYSKPGDIILHMGPLIAYDRLTTVEKIMEGLERGCKKYD